MLHFAWVLDEIPGNSATQRNSKDTTNAREKGQHVIIFHQQGGICTAVSVHFPLAAFQLPASCADACLTTPIATDEQQIVTDRHRNADKTLHSTRRSLAPKLVPSGCRYSMQLHCTKRAELPVSTSRTPPHCGGRRLLSVSQRRWAMYCRLFHNVPSTCAFTHVPSTTRSQSRNGALPRWQRCSPAMATAYSPLLSPARESEGGAAAMYEHGAVMRHTVKMRVECSTKRQAKSTRP